MIDRSRKTSRVRAGALFTRLGGFLAVAGASYVVRRAYVQHGDSAKVLPAGSGVMAEEKKPKTCTGCRGEQEATNKIPRLLESLPVTGRMFKKKNVAVDLCGYCDGEALALAKRPSKS